MHRARVPEAKLAEVCALADILHLARRHQPFFGLLERECIAFIVKRLLRETWQKACELLFDRCHVLGCRRDADGEILRAEQARQQVRRRLLQFCKRGVEVLEEAFDERIVWQAALIDIGCGLCEIRRDARGHDLMGAALHTELDGDLLLLQKFLDALLVRENALGEDFFQEREELRQFRNQRFRLHLELRQEALRRIFFRIGAEVEADAAGMEVREVREVHVAMRLRIDAAKQRAEQVRIRQVFLRNSLRVEIELQVGDAIRRDVAFEQLHARLLLDFERPLVCFLADVLALEHGNLRECFGAVRRLLALFECFRGRDDPAQVFVRHLGAARRELLLHGLLLLRCHRL